MEKIDQRMELGANAGAPALARDLVADALSDRDPGTVHGASLVVSELVSNAVRHGSTDGDAVAIELSIEPPGRLRIEVTDSGDGFDPERRPDRRGDGGFGLQIVDRLAERWGNDGGSPHTVWCELSLP